MNHTCYDFQFFYRSALNSLKISGSEKKTPKLSGSFVDRTCKFDVFSNSLHKISHALTFIRNQFHVFKPIAWVFYWNNLIYKDAWAMMSGEWELYVTAKLLTNFKFLKAVSTSLPALEKKAAYL